MVRGLQYLGGARAGACWVPWALALICTCQESRPARGSPLPLPRVIRTTQQGRWLYPRLTSEVTGQAPCLGPQPVPRPVDTSHCSSPPRCPSQVKGAGRGVAQELGGSRSCLTRCGPQACRLPLRLLIPPEGHRLRASACGPWVGAELGQFHSCGGCRRGRLPGQVFPGWDGQDAELGAVGRR